MRLRYIWSDYMRFHRMRFAYVRVIPLNTRAFRA
jgi:hypothetical protein